MVFLAWAPYQFVFYIISHLKFDKHGRDKKQRFFMMLNILVGLAYLILLAVNLFTGIIFSFTETVSYAHGSLYYVIYAVPLYYLIVSIIIVFGNRDQFRKNQFFSAVAFVAISILGPVIQGIVCPNTLIACFTGAVALVIIIFSLETPDYQKLMDTMDELEKANKVAVAAREEAQRANSVKTVFLENMSHEVRTPINAVLGYNEMIMRETGESHTVEYALNIQAAGKTLLSMFNDILDFTQIDSGKLTVTNAPFSVMSLVQDVMIYAHLNAEKKGLELRFHIDEETPQMLVGDVIRLTQILNNLISNAIKFTDSGYVEVDIRWKRESSDYGNLSATISDTGIGMKSEDMEKISGEFLRFDNKHTRNIQGIGLGLTIVTRLLELMNSHLRIESEYGKGSTFGFEIRQKVSNAAPVGKIEIGTERTMAYMQSRGVSDDFIAPDVRILAVDDNEMNLGLLTGILKSTGIAIDTALDGSQALDKLRANKYHLVLLDHMMPVMDGVEALRHIKEEHICDGVPIIAVTANASDGARENYFSYGFDDYLAKPVNARQLKDIIRKFVPADLIREASDGVFDSAPVITQVREKPAETQQSFEQRFFFLDTTVGLKYCCENKDFYCEMMETYLNSNKLADIQKYYEEEDWENYRILVHALKSTSLSIGAADLSEEAKSLELAARENHIDFIKENNDTVMEHYRHILSDIENALKEPTENPAAEQSDSEIESANILIVDDDAVNLRIAKKMLGERFRVDCVRSGREALKFLEKHGSSDRIPDLIMLDVHMPDMDGFETLHCIKQNSAFADIPVVFLTADSDRDTEVRSFLEGAYDYITKPFIADIMTQRIARILELTRLQKNLSAEVAKQSEQSEKRLHKFESLSVQMMTTLASTVDARDKFTSGHSKRVADYSREIARRMSKDENEQEDIYYIALLHDIGKIGVPDEILNKTDDLTADELEIIKTHPVIGSDILKNITEMAGLAAGARWHHERYDGTGYPDGLKGNDIDEAARIICVADAYDAMTSNRAYRSIMPQNQVRTEIIRGMGTQFDPEIASIMLLMIENDKDYKMRDPLCEIE
jgi:response regulator RpfG family c-di-GMP phosphodiesterase/signal transduction histidine kinase